MFRLNTLKHLIALIQTIFLEGVEQTNHSHQAIWQVKEVFRIQFLKSKLLSNKVG